MVGPRRQRQPVQLRLPQRTLPELRTHLDAQEPTWDASGPRIWLRLKDDGRLSTGFAARSSTKMPPRLRGRLATTDDGLLLAGSIRESRNNAYLSSLYFVIAGWALIGLVAAVALRASVVADGLLLAVVVLFALIGLAVNAGRRLTFEQDADQLRRELERRLLDRATR